MPKEQISIRDTLTGMMLALVGLMVSQSGADVEQLHAWGLKHLEKVQKEFRLPSGFYREVLTKKSPAFNWGVGVLIPALNSGAVLEDTWKTELRSVLKSSKRYWNSKGPVAGFDVLPAPKPIDRFYDDNAWMVLGLVESAKILDDPKILELAKQSLTYVLSGHDEKLGGGIYWREKIKDSKNTCSNAPSIAACLEIYNATKEPKLLQTAVKLYDWTKANLQDPKDLLYWDSKRLTGQIDHTKWSYNTALMIRSAAMLYKATGDAKYQTDAVALADASEKKWLVNGRIADEGKFGFLLLDSWKYVPSPSRAEAHRKAVEWLYLYGRTKDGWIGSRFDRTPSEKYVPALIDQVSAIRALLTAE